MGHIRGNAIVGQSGGPTAAINATLCGVIRGMLEHAPKCRLFGMRNGIEGCLEERMVDLTDLFTLEDGVTPDEHSLRLLTHTPAAALGSCRRKLPDPDAAENEPFYEKLLGIFKKNPEISHIQQHFKIAVFYIIAGTRLPFKSGAYESVIVRQNHYSHISVLLSSLIKGVASAAPLLLVEKVAALCYTIS